MKKSDDKSEKQLDRLFILPIDYDQLDPKQQILIENKIKIALSKFPLSEEQIDAKSSIISYSFKPVGIGILEQSMDINWVCLRLFVSQKLVADQSLFSFRIMIDKNSKQAYIQFHSSSPILTHLKALVSQLEHIRFLTTEFIPTQTPITIDILRKFTQPASQQTLIISASSPTSSSLEEKNSKGKSSMIAHKIIQSSSFIEAKRLKESAGVSTAYSFWQEQIKASVQSGSQIIITGHGHSKRSNTIISEDGISYEVEDYVKAILENSSLQRGDSLRLMLWVCEAAKGEDCLAKRFVQNFASHGIHCVVAACQLEIIRYQQKDDIAPHSRYYQLLSNSFSQSPEYFEFFTWIGDIPTLPRLADISQILAKQPILITTNGVGYSSKHPRLHSKRAHISTLTAQQIFSILDPSEKLRKEFDHRTYPKVPAKTEGAQLTVFGKFYQDNEVLIICTKTRVAEYVPEKGRFQWKGCNAKERLYSFNKMAGMTVHIHEEKTDIIREITQEDASWETIMQTPLADCDFHGYTRIHACLDQDLPEIKKAVPGDDLILTVEDKILEPYIIHQLHYQISAIQREIETTAIQFIQQRRNVIKKFWIYNDIQQQNRQMPYFPPLIEIPKTKINRDAKDRSDSESLTAQYIKLNTQFSRLLSTKAEYNESFTALMMLEAEIDTLIAKQTETLSEMFHAELKTFMSESLSILDQYDPAHLSNPILLHHLSAQALSIDFKTIQGAKFDKAEDPSGNKSKITQILLCIYLTCFELQSAHQLEIPKIAERISQLLTYQMLLQTSLAQLLTASPIKKDDLIHQNTSRFIETCGKKTTYFFEFIEANAQQRAAKTFHPSAHNSPMAFLSK